MNLHSLDAVRKEAAQRLDQSKRGMLGQFMTPSAHAADFIEQAVVNLGTQKGARFTHAILNPPYKKMNANSVHRLLLRKVNVETVNLYTAFVALAILLMREGGEIVAIIPRSFCNGAYYRAFRELLLAQCAIRQIHLFDSRNKAFAEDEVLQENLILHLVKNAPQGQVKVTTSHDARFADITETCHPFDDIVRPDDSERFIHVPTPPKRGAIELERFQDWCTAVMKRCRSGLSPTYPAPYLTAKVKVL
jgi:adenine-specific DNA-methyltransferase